LDGVHGGEFEESDGFGDVVREDGGSEGHFGEGFGDSDDGFQLTVEEEGRRRGERERERKSEDVLVQRERERKRET